jgi:glucan phosphoethanolaminetransferase (alkaline phosphatase superfamily)
MGILNKIRQKPNDQKKIFSLVSALVLTLIIIVVWISFNKDFSASKVVEKEPSKLSSISPIKMIKEEFSKAFSDFNTKMTDLEINSTASSSLISEEIIEATSTVTSTASTTENNDLNI